jgi:hypothetical protein
MIEVVLSHFESFIRSSRKELTANKNSLETDCRRYARRNSNLCFIFILSR